MNSSMFLRAFKAPSKGSNNMSHMFLISRPGNAHPSPETSTSIINTKQLFGGRALNLSLSRFFLGSQPVLHECTLSRSFLASQSLEPQPHGIAFSNSFAWAHVPPDPSHSTMPTRLNSKTSLGPKRRDEQGRTRCRRNTAGREE
jgi:hypothetical protein